MSVEQESTSGIIIEWISQIASTAYFLTPLIPIINVYKNKLSIKKIPLFLLITIILNCLLWLTCGLTRKAEEGGIWISMIITNGIGLLTNFVIFLLYLHKFFQKRLPVFIAFIFFIVVVLVESFLILYFLVGKYDTIGICGMIVNILMYASPSLNIVKLIKTGEYDFLPIVTNSIGFVCCLLWIIYGIIVTEGTSQQFRIIGSNSISLIVVLIQIGYWSYYFYKKQVQPFDGNILDKEGISGGKDSKLTEDTNNESESKEQESSA